MSQTDITCQEACETTSKAEDTRRPNYKVSESDDAFNVRVELPGVSRERLDISIDDNILKVVGTRAKPVSESWSPVRRELRGGDYQLSLRVNVSVDQSQIKAAIEDGVLNLTLPKPEVVKPRKIKIS